MVTAVGACVMEGKLRHICCYRRFRDHELGEATCVRALQVDDVLLPNLQDEVHNKRSAASCLHATRMQQGENSTKQLEICMGAPMGWKVQ